MGGGRVADTRAVTRGFAVEVGLVVKTVNVSAIFFGPAKYRKRIGRFFWPR